MNLTVKQIALMIDHSVLHPTATDGELRKQCEIAMKLQVASVCVKPYHAELAATLLNGSGVLVCTVVGFPHGNSDMSTKMVEASTAIQMGATELDMVINIGKALQEDWEYIEEEIGIIQTISVTNQVKLKVIFETDYLTSDTHKIRLCEICNDAGVSFVKTSTGFGFVKDTVGHFNVKGATEHDVRLMRKHCHPKIGVKASGGIRRLDQLLALHTAGATRFGSSNTEAILAEARTCMG